MKKKVLLISLIIVTLAVGLLSLTGCGKKKEDKKEEAPVEVLDESTVKINGLEFKLNKETSFQELSYKIAEEFREANFDRYVQYYYYQEDSTNLLFYRIFLYENKDINESIEDLGLDQSIALTDGKTDNIEYKLYVEPREDGGTIHYYFVNSDKGTYVIGFVSKYDIKDFEEKVLKSIKFM